MSRNGVDYETVKQTAIKLLSQGTAPSVQKIREVLGTGSNTTIAEHLKVWRNEYAKKTIHHLPANMPKELISVFEVLWQTAIEQAGQQLTSIKEELTTQQENLRTEKQSYEKINEELRASCDSALKSVEEKNLRIQTLQMELAVAHEKLKQQSEETLGLKNRLENQLNRAYAEKNQEIEKSEKLQMEITRLNQHISAQIEKHQHQLNEARTRQEASEQRWLMLIDRARSETHTQRKQSEIALNKQAVQIEKLQSAVLNLQQKQSAQQTLLAEKEARITGLSEQHQHLQLKHQEAITTLAVLQERHENIIRTQTRKNTETSKNKNSINLTIEGQ